jgi:hypothetical protein
MMKYIKPCLFLCTLLLICINVKAQSINGDTIYVDAKAEIAVRFPSMPSNFYTIPANAPYNIKTLSTGFTIIAKKKNTPPVPLFVTESKRTHNFILVFKKNIDYTNVKETDYDFSTTKKLKERVKQLETREKKYEETIEAADKLFKNEDYIIAKQFYAQALGLLNKEWPKEQIAKINKLLKKQKRKNNTSSSK